jgi:hypothetical protein
MKRASPSLPIYDEYASVIVDRLEQILALLEMVGLETDNFFVTGQFCLPQGGTLDVLSCRSMSTMLGFDSSGAIGCYENSASGANCSVSGLASHRA